MEPIFQPNLAIWTQISPILVKSPTDLDEKDVEKVVEHPTDDEAACEDDNMLETQHLEECTQGVRSNAQVEDTSNLEVAEDAMEDGGLPTTPTNDPPLQDFLMEETSSPQTQVNGEAMACAQDVRHNAVTTSLSNAGNDDTTMQGGDDPMSPQSRSQPTVGSRGEVLQQGTHEANPWPRRPNAWRMPKHHEVHFDEEGCPLAADGKSVKLNPAGIQRNRRKLERALVGHTLGRKLPYAVLKSSLERMWGGFGEFSLLTLTSECFLCVFEEVDARDAILMKGPWYIAGQIIGLDKWSPSFRPTSLQGLFSPVWIRLPFLPLLYWDNDNIARIASRIGKPLWVDSQTDDWGRCSYARICVRVDLSTSLPPGVWVEGEDGSFYQRVEYEGISQLCFKCGRLGHKSEQCRSDTGGPTTSTPPLQPAPPPSHPVRDHPHQVQDTTGGATSSPPPVQTVEEHLSPPLDDTHSQQQQEGYGAWTLVSRRKKQGQKKKAPSSTPRKDTPRPERSTGTPDAPGQPTLETDTAMDADSTPHPPPTDPLFGFSAKGGQPPRAPRSSTASSSRNRAGQSRVSKAHFQKEIAQLGPVVPMKRKKTSQDAPHLGDRQPIGVT